MFRLSMMFVVAALMLSPGCRARPDAPAVPAEAAQEKVAPAVPAEAAPKKVAPAVPADAAQDKVAPVTWRDPVKLGMSRAELMGVLDLDEPATPLLSLLNPGTIAPAIDVVLANGTPATVVFDREERVCCIWTTSGQVRLPGSIGVGSTYAEVSNVHPNAKRTSWPGYGILVQVGQFTWLLFPNDPVSSRATIPTDEPRALAIEFRDDI